MWAPDWACGAAHTGAAHPVPSIPSHPLTSVSPAGQAQAAAYPKAKRVRISIVVSCSQSQPGHSSSQPITAWQEFSQPIRGLARLCLANHVGPMSAQSILDGYDSVQPILVCTAPVPNLPRNWDTQPPSNHSHGICPTLLSQSWHTLHSLHQSQAWLVQLWQIRV